MRRSGGFQKLLKIRDSGFQEGFSARCSKAGSYAIGQRSNYSCKRLVPTCVQSSPTGHGFSFEGVKGEGRHGRCFEACTPILRLKANC